MTETIQEVAADRAQAERRLAAALARARGLAAQNRQLKRSNHELHVAWQKEIDNRTHGEGLRAQIRDLKEELQMWFEISTDAQKAKVAEFLEARAQRPDMERIAHDLGMRPSDADRIRLPKTEGS